ncbi:MAG: ATP-binding protein [Bacteroidales bacterium]|nr:ATP-binding protein [Bacteroidales bacterium]
MRLKPVTRKKLRVVTLSALGVVLLGVLVGCVMSYIVQSVRPQHHVAVIFSHEETNYTHGQYLLEVNKAFRQRGYKVQLHPYFVDCERYGDDWEIRQCESLLKTLVSEVHPEVVVLVGDQGTYSTLKAEENVHSGYPMIFSGVIYPNQSLIKNNRKVTGFRDAIDIPTNVHLAELFHFSKSLYTTLDYTYLDHKTRENITLQLKNQDDIFNNLMWDVSLRETALYPDKHYSFSLFSLRDIEANFMINGRGLDLWDGNEKVDFQKALYFFRHMTYLQTKCDLSSQSMLMFDMPNPYLTAINEGFGSPTSRFIAGYFTSTQQMATEVADVAISIIQGAKPSEIPIQDSPKEYYIDWQVAKNHGLKLDELPEGFQIVNLSWREEHPNIFLGLVLGGTLFLSVIILMLLLSVRRERMQKRLVQAHLEHERQMYQLAVGDSQTFAWAREGDTMIFPDSFWQHFNLSPRKLHVDELASMVASESLPDYREALQKTSEGKAWSSTLLLDIAGTGESHWWQIRSRGMLNKKGQLDCSYGMIINVDDFKHTEQELILNRKLANQANEAKTTFLTSMSHDIRTPMNAIIGFTQLAMKNVDKPDVVKSYLKKILVSGNHLLSLINDVLDMSRIESGQTRLEAQQVNLHEMLVDLRSIVQSNVQAKELSLIIDDQHLQQPWVMVDKLRLNQVLLNIVGNAIKFTPVGGKIILVLAEHDASGSGTASYVFHIKDTGIGMSESYLKHIFEPFTREETATVSGIQGSGLGMAITKNIVDMMQGTITVSSQEGKGTEFVVMLELPVASGPDQTQEEPQEEIDFEFFEGKRILVAEDNDLNRELIHELLSDFGLELDIAADGLQALNLYLSHESGYYDLIITDIQMPVMDGYAFCRSVRCLSDSAMSQIPILALTANAFDEDKQLALQSQMNGHLTKPIVVEEVLRTIYHVLQE